MLSTIALPSDFMAAASAGVKDMSGTWQDNSADASGHCGAFRNRRLRRHSAREGHRDRYRRRW